MSSLKPLTDKLQEVHNHKPADIIISRVPKKIVIAFKDLAREEFCNDYGMTLKFLVDGLVSADTQLLMVKVEELEDRMFKLEHKPVEKIVEQKKTVKMIDGSVKAVGGIEK